MARKPTTTPRSKSAAKTKAAPKAKPKTPPKSKPKARANAKSSKPSSSARPTRPAQASQTASKLGSNLRVDQIMMAREVFWQNMMRELLTSLSVLSAQIASRRAAAARLTAPLTIKTPDPAAPTPTPPATPEAIPAIDGVAGAVISRAMHSNSTLSDPLPDNDDEDDSDEESFSVPDTVGKEPGNVFDGRLAVITSLGQRVPIAEVHPVFACGVRDSNGANLLSTIIECSVFEIRTPGGEVYTLPIHEIKAFHALTPELVEELGKAMGVQNGEDATQPFGFAAFTSLARNQGALSEVPVVEREWQGE